MTQGSIKTLHQTQQHVLLSVEMVSEQVLKNVMITTHLMEMAANLIVLLSNQAGYVAEAAQLVGILVNSAQLDTTKTLPQIRLLVSQNEETVSELDLKNETTTTHQMEMVASQIARV